jgi:hypothetical protein
MNAAVERRAVRAHGQQPTSEAGGVRKKCAGPPFRSLLVNDAFWWLGA